MRWGQPSASLTNAGSKTDKDQSVSRALEFVWVVLVWKRSIISPAITVITISIIRIRTIIDILSSWFLCFYVVLTCTVMRYFFGSDCRSKNGREGTSDARQDSDNETQKATPTHTPSFQQRKSPRDHKPASPLGLAFPGLRKVGFSTRNAAPNSYPRQIPLLHLVQHQVSPLEGATHHLKLLLRQYVGTSDTPSPRKRPIQAKRNLQSTVTSTNVASPVGRLCNATCCIWFARLRLTGAHPCSFESSLLRLPLEYIATMHRRIRRAKILC